MTAKLDEKETPKLRTYRAVIGLNERVLFSSEPVEDPAELGEQRAQELKQQLQRFGDRLRGAVCVAKSEASDGAQFMDLLAPATAAVKNSENVREAVCMVQTSVFNSICDGDRLWWGEFEERSRVSRMSARV